jgi:hypothetical protein
MTLGDGDGDGDWRGTSGDGPDPADSSDEELLVLDELSTAAFSRGTVNMFDGCALFSISVF